VPLRLWLARSSVQPGAPGLRAVKLSHLEWRAIAQDVAAAGGRLLALWASRGEGQRPVAHATFLTDGNAIIASARCDVPECPFARIDDLFPAAERMQRAATDLSGVCFRDADSRPWLRHAAWPPDFRPLIDADRPVPPPEPAMDRYEFVRVTGDGVHEIPVGPVHAGTIEPGHFRFSVVGEKVLKLEERLGYVHKGIERRFTELPILEGHRLAARVSGDSAVAFSWAYCQALEGMSGVVVPARAAWLRALCLELERVANHLGDLGALGNDAGFAFGLAQFSRLKEELLRATQQALGARYLNDVIVPGGMSRDLDATGVAVLRACVGKLLGEVPRLRGIYAEHEGVRDRFNGAGIVTATLARRLGLTGLAGRASGQAFDLRVDQPWEPYTTLSIAKAGASEGDVAARVSVRFDEVLESCGLIQRILHQMPEGDWGMPLHAPTEGAVGAGLIEGWRGPVFLVIEAGADGKIRRCHPHDPSWQNWPAVEHAVIGNIVPDFPLINKSFNLSYSGHDL
jgi:Ni,Fe-hydrogenase III large subunit